MKALTLAQIIKFVNGQIISSINNNELNTILIEEICTDSRKATENSLFIPILGERFDGHDYIDAAAVNGCKVFLCHQDLRPSKGRIYIKVEDTKKALRDLAEEYIKLFDIKVIGVTGSVGKTTCKDMIAASLSGKYNVLKTLGNFNNDIGLPLTVFNIEEHHDIAVLEMGMNHFGEIELLSKIARPDYAVITNIGVSHIENLGSRDGICKAKCEIFTYAKENGKVIINNDDDYHETIIRKAMKKNMKTITIGINQDADYKGTDITSYLIRENHGIISKLHTQVVYNQGEFEVILGCLGKHLVYNLLPGIAIAFDLGLSLDEIIAGLKSYIPTEKRLNAYKCGKNITIIDDVYNASPDSMKAALKTLDELETIGRKIAFLGDMLEMGDFAKKGHREVGEQAASLCLDYIIAIGDNATYIQESYQEKKDNIIYFENTKQAIAAIDNIIEENDTILLKASRGMHFEEIIEKIKEVTR
ncbi:UDP-N-acetylmuramoyl-tripeptide--D-alanyl-D-alanine ligase [Vallitalea okinawensis]|uniref:UDP-N-acetylmuramoyl-tripeptide--D-alanyl-D- alanine ligase n=1 Tax=Vallitalea okinawensis TaxID=2078660 RepID=UPI000CFB329D|nr:UDP-N-acetylmuramoyl-tripeptide--D-alanyl-D-alanine ligase [Vallitalea okinawensis]